MPFELKDIDISMISLVKAGANGKQVILKTADDTVKITHTQHVAIQKFDEVQGIVYGIVYAPEQVDSQGDFAKADEIRNAAYKFMKNRYIPQIDKEHDGQVKPAFVAESWIVKSGDPLFPTESPGAWAVGIKLEDPDLISAVQKGEIAGLSMAGTATKIPIEKTEITTEKSIMEKIFKALETFGFKKAGEPVPPEKTPPAPADSKAEDGDKPKGEMAALAQAIGDGLAKLQAQGMDMAERLSGLEKSATNSRQTEVPSNIDKSAMDADEKLGAEIAALVKRR